MNISSLQNVYQLSTNPSDSLSLSFPLSLSFSVSLSILLMVVGLGERCIIDILKIRFWNYIPSSLQPLPFFIVAYASTHKGKSFVVYSYHSKLTIETNVTGNENYDFFSMLSKAMQRNTWKDKLYHSCMIC